MLISTALLAHLGACPESMAHYFPDLQKGPLRYWIAYNKMLANPPENAGDVQAWTRWMDGLQTRADAIKFEGRFRSENIWRLVANGTETFHSSLASAMAQKKRDVDLFLGDLHLRYSTVAVIPRRAETRFTPVTDANQNEDTVFELADENGGKHRVRGWVAAENKAADLASNFLSKDKSVFEIHQKIMDTDDGFTAWDVVKGV